jgi:hypothetical protein
VLRGRSASTKKPAKGKKPTKGKKPAKKPAKKVQESKVTNTRLGQEFVVILITDCLYD